MAIAVCAVTLSLTAVAGAHEIAPTADLPAGALKVDAAALAPLAAPARSGVARAASSGPSWCGPARRTDDRRHAAFRGLPTVKLVYAYPAGAPNRLAHFAPVLQANAAVLMRYVAEQSGFRKTVRFDLGTACGEGFADIQVVALKRRAGHYIGDDGLPTVSEGSPLRRELRRATRGQRRRGGKKFLVYADGLNPVERGALTAAGETDDLPQDDRRTPHNAANRGGQLAVVFGPDGGLPAQRLEGFETRLFLHELLHTLGAVQESAPHATAGGHCFDGADVMCYRDLTARSALYTDRACRTRGGALAEPLDCGGDDYFNPEPAAGSYLASHWNVYDSYWLGRCDEPQLAAACAPPATPAAAAPAEPEAPAPETLRTEAPVAAADGRSLGAIVVEAELEGGAVSVSGFSTPLSAPGPATRVEACLVVEGGPQSAPWRSCQVEELDETVFRAPEMTVPLQRPPTDGTVVRFEVTVEGAGGPVATGAAQLGVPGAPAA
jgi:hypothetical protein